MNAPESFDTPDLSTFDFSVMSRINKYLVKSQYVKVECIEVTDSAFDFVWQKIKNEWTQN